MACLIQRPSAQALFDNYRNMFSANVLGGSPVIPETNEWYVVALNYAMAEEFYAISEQAWKEREPRFACCENLTAMAAADGVFPKPAAFAQGYVVLTGTAGTVLPSRIEIIASNGRNYATIGRIPSSFPSSGSLTLRVQDTQPGSAGNASGTATTATLATAIAGVDSAVTVCGGSFCGGAEAETCEAFRTRYIARKQYQPRATQAWAIQKLLEWPCATRVIPRGGSCCSCDDGCGGDCNCQTCGGRLDFYVMFDDAFPCGVAPDNIVSEIDVWMFGENKGFGQGEVEIGVCGSVVSARPFDVDVTIDIEGCPTVAQIAEIRSQVTDLFKTIAPSQPLRAKQVDLIVANIVGADVNTSARLTPVIDDPAFGFVSECGDIEPACDYLPCLRNIVFTGPSGASTGTC